MLLGLAELLVAWLGGVQGYGEKWSIIGSTLWVKLVAGMTGYEGEWQEGIRMT